MKTVMIVAGALVVGIALGVIYCEATYRHLRKRLRELRAGRGRRNILRSVTRFLFVTTQVAALVWVFTSYGIAIYSTIRLGQVYTMSELSEPAIHTILGVGFLKVLENIFEHNEGPVFGSNSSGGTPSIPDEEEIDEGG